MLDVGAPWAQASGPQAPRPFHSESQSNKKKNPAGTLVLWNLWLISLKNVTLCDPTGMLVNLHWQLRGSRDLLNESRFIFNIALADEYAHSSQTYRGHYTTPKYSHGNRGRQQQPWQRIEKMNKWLWHSGRSRSVSCFSLMIQCGRMSYEHNLHSQRDKQWHSLAVTHYIATITTLKLCMQTVTVSTINSPVASAFCLKGIRSLLWFACIYKMER